METETKTGALIGSWIGRARAVFEKWSAAVTVATFLLYFFGYLSLRFHLSAIGIATDLSALDERYLFAGARFLVNLLGAMPFALVLFLALRWIAARVPQFAELEPATLVTASLWIHIVALALLFLPALQLLPLDDAPDSRLRAMVFEQQPDRFALFVLQIAVWMAAAAIWSAACEKALDDGWQRARLAMSTALLALMALLLPVNYGIVVERYAAYASCNAGGERGWMIWDGRNFVHYIAQRSGGRVFLSIPAAEVKRHELRGAVSLLPLLPGRKEQAVEDWSFCLAEKIAEKKDAVPPVQPQPPKLEPTPPPKPATVSSILRGLGFGPINVQGGSVAEPGEVWEVRPGSPPRRLAQGSFDSPAAQPATGAVFAIRDSTVVRANGAAVKKVAGVRRLIGFAPDAPARLALWLGEGNVRLLDVSTGELTTPEGAAPDWLPATMASQVLRQGGRKIEPQKRGVAGSDIYDGETRIADCEGDYCGQPFLASDGRVLFIRAVRPK